MPYLNGIYLSEQNYDALGEIAKREEKSRVQYVKALIEERVQNQPKREKRNDNSKNVV